MAVFAACCTITMLLAATLHQGPYGAAGATLALTLGLQFALIMTSLGVVFSLFRVGEPKSLTVVFLRTAVVLTVGFPITYALFTFDGAGFVAREVLGSACLYALAGVVLIRAAVSAVQGTGVGLQRILIIGTGPEALAVERVVEQEPRRSVVVGFYPVGAHDEGVTRNAGSAASFPRSADLPTIVERFKVDEVIVAVREQRGGVLPIRCLLECRTRGVPVRDLSAFYERVRGEVPIESLKASWLIYGDGFAQDRIRTVVKRIFDATLAATLLLLSLPVMFLAGAAIVLESGDRFSVAGARRPLRALVFVRQVPEHACRRRGRRSGALGESK